MNPAGQLAGTLRGKDNAESCSLGSLNTSTGAIATGATRTGNKAGARGALGRRRIQ